jgi:hypothetical protein
MISSTIFVIQETIISSIYLFEIYKLLKSSEAYKKKESRQVMKNLAFANLIIIMMDIVFLCLDWTQLLNMWSTFKAVIYSIKLTIEFVILNKLKDITKSQCDLIFSGPTSLDTRSNNAGTPKSEKESPSCPEAIDSGNILKSTGHPTDTQCQAC